MYYTVPFDHGNRKMFWLHRNANKRMSFLLCARISNTIIYDQLHLHNDEWFSIWISVPISILISIPIVWYINIYVWTNDPSWGVSAEFNSIESVMRDRDYGILNIQTHNKHADVYLFAWRCLTTLFFQGDPFFFAFVLVASRMKKFL